MQGYFAQALSKAHRTTCFSIHFPNKRYSSYFPATCLELVAPPLMRRNKCAKAFVLPTRELMRRNKCGKAIVLPARELMQQNKCAKAVKLLARTQLLLNVALSMLRANLSNDSIHSCHCGGCLVLIQKRIYIFQKIGRKIVHSPIGTIQLSEEGWYLNCKFLHSMWLIQRENGSQ